MMPLSEVRPHRPFLARQYADKHARSDQRRTEAAGETSHAESRFGGFQQGHGFVGDIAR